MRQRLMRHAQCLANGIVPFIITGELKLFYYHGLRECGNVQKNNLLQIRRRSSRKEI